MARSYEGKFLICYTPPERLDIMPKMKGTLKVHPPACGHTGPFQGKMNPQGQWQGTCVQCGGPVKIEMTLEPPRKIGFKKE
jgi:hypothetical protein